MHLETRPLLPSISGFCTGPPLRHSQGLPTPTLDHPGWPLRGPRCHRGVFSLKTILHWEIHLLPLSPRVNSRVSWISEMEANMKGETCNEDFFLLIVVFFFSKAMFKLINIFLWSGKRVDHISHFCTFPCMRLCSASASPTWKVGHQAARSLG